MIKWVCPDCKGYGYITIFEADVSRCSECKGKGYIEVQYSWRPSDLKDTQE